MTKITKEEVKKVAHLARLELNENEINNHVQQLEKILDYIRQLEKINTDDVPCTTRAIEVLNVFRNSEYSFIDISDDELSKNHLRHMVGGRLPKNFKEMDNRNFVERLYRFEFPERPGALINFLNNMKSNWSISVFHYRNYGADVGKIVIGVLIDKNEILEWNNFVRILGYKFWDETQNDTYRLFLGASD